MPQPQKRARALSLDPKWLGETIGRLIVDAIERHANAHKREHDQLLMTVRGMMSRLDAAERRLRQIEEKSR